jgi:hypothetical protein
MTGAHPKNASVPVPCSRPPRDVVLLASSGISHGENKRNFAVRLLNVNSTRQDMWRTKRAG